ncbi:MAG: hypothetical protein IKZ21_06385, partial [Clostridia bacterium]|nr:hypothetical protein [Clostridia bacterium]
ADGRHSWDPMLVLLALIGEEQAAGYDRVSGWAVVDPDTGANHFTPDPTCPHAYVVKHKPDDFYRNAINRSICS